MVKNGPETLMQESLALYAALENETADFFAALQSEVDIDFAAFDAWRQKIIPEVQNIDAKVQLSFEQPAVTISPEIRSLLKDFAARRAEHVRRILETDASIIALAEQIASRIKSELKSIDRGRHALQGYSSAGYLSTGAVDKKA